MCAAVEAGGDPSLVPYRYNLTATSSGKTNCYKPNNLAANFDHQSHKPWSLGAVFQGNLQHVPRQDTSKTAAVVWEAVVAFLEETICLMLAILYLH